MSSLRELHRGEAEHVAAPAAVTRIAFVRRGHVVRRAERIDDAVGRGDRVATVGLPDVGNPHPAAWQELQQPRLYPYSVACEFLPDLRSDRELPRVFVARVNRRAFGQRDPPLLGGAVAPQLEARAIATHAGRDSLHRARRVEAGLGQTLGQRGHGFVVYAIAGAVRLTAAHRTRGDK